MPNREQLQDFVVWGPKHITGDKEGEAQVVLDHLLQVFGHSGRHSDDSENHSDL
jgi:hypothetical protein